MARLLVLTTPELAPGYQLAGVATVTVSTVEETADVLLRVLGEARDRGVVAVHESHLEALRADLRRRVDASEDPLVVALPAGDLDARTSQRRARLLRMLSQAVGFRMSFGPEDEA